MINYWALQQLAVETSSDDQQLQYDETWRALQGTVQFADTSAFEVRLADCPEPHRRKWLEMYANPVVNKHRSKSSSLAPI